MAWLLRDGEVLASLEIAGTTAARVKGLLGRDDFDGAFLLRPALQVHTLGMRFPLDIAFVDRDLRVVDCLRGVRPWRVTLPRMRSRGVIEAEAGCFARWNLAVGDELEIR